MNERTKRQLARLAPLWKTLALFFGGGLLGGLSDGIGTQLLVAALGGGDEYDWRLARLVQHVVHLVGMTWGTAVVGSVVALVVGALARMLARSHVRAGLADPLQRRRDFVARHPRWTAVLTSLPALAWSALMARIAVSSAAAGPWEVMLPQVVFPVGVAFIAIAYLGRAALRAYLAPTLDRDSTDVGVALDAEGFTFDAVAVTPQTVGAVGAMSALSVIAVVTVMSRQAMSFVHQTHTGSAFLAAYVAMALGGAYLFARKSKISIGLDGVLVGGTTKRRFVAYRDIDHARATGETIELRARDRTVLRLQLHGEDAGRRIAIVERLNAAIARVKTHRADPAAAFVEGASVAELTRAAEGAASYRMAAPTREKLWEIFESPVLATEARRAAAEALVPGIDAEERTRFRVAADQVAEPVTRVRLQELLDDDAAEEEEQASRPARVLDAPVYR